MEIYLIRHGETATSGTGQYIGSSEFPLSEEGKRQAQRLADALQHIHFDACYCSIMGRCQETARIIAAPHQLNLIPVKDLREIHYGAWETLTLPDMERVAPETFRAWQDDPGSAQAPDGESGDDVLARTQPAFEKIARDHAGQRVLLVAHRTVNRIWLCHLMGHPISMYRKAVGQEFTALNILEYSAQTQRFSVKTVNDTSHLSSSSMS